MAAVAMVFAHYDSARYRTFMQSLTNSGFAEVNGHIFKLKQRICDIENNFFKKASMPACDWFLLASMRNKCNFLFPYGGNMPVWYEKLSGSNFPSDLRRSFRLLGYYKIKDNMNGFWPIRSSAKENLTFLQGAYESGQRPVILINTKMYKNGRFSMLSNHFAVFNGQYTYDEITGQVSFNIWTFGYPNGKTITCTEEAFRNNYFGCMIWLPASDHGQHG